jgi:hypothetical protein
MVLLSKVAHSARRHTLGIKKEPAATSKGETQGNQLNQGMRFCTGKSVATLYGG